MIKFNMKFILISVLCELLFGSIAMAEISHESSAKGGFKCEVQHPSVIEQEAGPWDWPEPERGLVAGSASSGFCAGGR